MMYESAWPPDEITAPRRQRSHGQISFDVSLCGQNTRPVRIAESGPSRIRLPNVDGPALEAVIMNTGGGIACGDRFDIAIEARAGTNLVVTTPAAERCYRSDGPVATMDVRLRADAGASLSWLPQETLLYNHARLRRSMDVTLAPDCRFEMFECVVFGRAATGERVDNGVFEDRWRIRRDNALVYADTLRLEGPITELLQRPAIAKGARALATYLSIAPDAPSRIEEARNLLDNAACSCAASAWNGILAVRFLAPDIAALRRTAIHFLTRFRGTQLPRVWHS